MDTKTSAGGPRVNESEAKKKITVWSQWLAACALSLTVIGGGLANGWSSPYVAQLTKSSELTDSEASWVSSLLNLGRLTGVLLGAVGQDIIGRKKVLLLSGPPTIAGWICNICSTTATWLYISRFLAGIGTGFTWSTLSMYLSEIAHPTVRGSLIAMNVNIYSVGTFLANVMGTYMSIEVFGYVSLVPSVLFLILFFTLIPESPYDHLQHGHLDKAEAALKWFRRETDVEDEMIDLQKFVAGSQSSFLTKLKEMIKPGNLNKILLVCGTSLFAYIGGYSAVVYYAESILTMGEVGRLIEPNVVVMILSFCTIIAGGLAMVLVDKLGRKKLFMLSGAGGAISLALLGTHFHLLSLHYDPESLTWLPILSMLIYNLSLAVGLLPVPYALVGEMFAADMKNTASMCMNACIALGAFVCAKTYQPYLAAVEAEYVFWTYGICALIAVPYVYFLLPETTGKSLLEIQQSSKNKK